MAPEVLNGEDPSMASDFWSLGCVLHEMFTGGFFCLWLEQLLSLDSTGFHCKINQLVIYYVRKVTLVCITGT